MRDRTVSRRETDVADHGAPGAAARPTIVTESRSRNAALRRPVVGRHRTPARGAVAVTPTPTRPALGNGMCDRQPGTLEAARQPTSQATGEPHARA